MAFSKKSNHASAIINVPSGSSTINLPIVYFPEWQLTINHQNTKFTVEPNLGLIQLKLSPGNYDISLDFANTPIRTFANYLSLFGLALFVYKIIREKTL